MKITNTVTLAITSNKPVTWLSNQPTVSSKMFKEYTNIHRKPATQTQQRICTVCASNNRIFTVDVTEPISTLIVYLLVNQELCSHRQTVSQANITHTNKSNTQRMQNNFP